MPDVTDFDLAKPPPGFLDNPFPTYATLLQEAPVLRLRDGSVLLSRHADLDRVYRDTARFSSDKRDMFAPVFGRGAALYTHHTNSLVFNDPPLHTRVRKIMASALTPRAIARMEPGLMATVDRLLDRMGPRVDLIEEFASAIPVEIIGNLLDVPLSERGPLRDWSLAILGALEPAPGPEVLAQGNRAVEDFTAYLEGLVARRRATPGDPEVDVLTRLIMGTREGETLSETELLQNCIFILNAGHETTTNLIGNTLALLDDFRGERARLLADPDLIGPAIEESLRYLSPNQFGNRQAVEDVEIGGIEIAAGTVLHLCIGAANRDPLVFDAPKRFDITRKQNRHLAFAGGPHVCVGLTLARLEGKVAVSRFLQRFPSYRLEGARVPGGRIRFRGYARLEGVTNDS